MYVLTKAPADGRPFRVPCVYEDDALVGSIIRWRDIETDVVVTVDGPVRTIRLTHENCDLETARTFLSDLVTV
jgi:hypothetical protein